MLKDQAPDELHAITAPGLKLICIGLDGHHVQIVKTLNYHSIITFCCTKNDESTYADRDQDGSLVPESSALPFSVCL